LVTIIIFHEADIQVLKLLMMHFNIILLHKPKFEMSPCCSPTIGAHCPCVTFVSLLHLTMGVQINPHSPK
jgi:hypothetical protein